MGPTTIHCVSYDLTFQFHSCHHILGFLPFLSESPQFSSRPAYVQPTHSLLSTHSIHTASKEGKKYILPVKGGGKVHTASKKGGKVSYRMECKLLFYL